MNKVVLFFCFFGIGLWQVSVRGLHLYKLVDLVGGRTDYGSLQSYYR